MTTTTTVAIGDAELELGGPFLAELRSSSGEEDVAVLRQRLEDDGYLLLRGLLPRALVERARDRIFGLLAEHGRLDPAAPLSEGRVRPGNTGSTALKPLQEDPDLLAVLEGPELAGFFERFLGEAVITTRYKWLRAQQPDGFTGAHFDNVYMGRGSKRLHTSWVPFCDIPIGMGGLAVLGGSHKLDSFRKLRATYGQMDVDRDMVQGHFSNDPVEVVERYGGRWLTAAFEPGDIMVFGMFTMHMSQVNRMDRFRATADVRWQPAADPCDERWFGDAPAGHYSWGGKAVGAELKPMSVARSEWGV